MTEHDKLEIKGSGNVEKLTSLIKIAIEDLSNKIDKVENGKIDIHYLNIEVKYR